MSPRPLVWAFWSLGAHAVVPAFMLLLMESERPGEGLSRAWRLFPFGPLLVYVPAAAFLAYCLARFAKRRASLSHGLLVVALAAVDAACLFLVLGLGQDRGAVTLFVPVLPVALGAVSLSACRPNLRSQKG